MTDRQHLAARLHAAADVRVEPETAPIPRAGETLIRMTAVGLCGSDLHWFTEGGIGDAQLTRPLVPGHEMAGVVADGPRSGERVAVDPAIACLTCDMCLRGHHNLCRNVLFAGHSVTDGGLQQTLAWPTRLLHALPDEIDDDAGAMLEPLGVAIHAVDLAHLELAGTVAVLGCGPIGLCIAQAARASGARVVLGVDPLAHRRDLARRLGVAQVLDPAADQFADHLQSVVEGGVDVVFEVAGTDDAIAAAVHAVRPGGRVVLAGIPDDDRSAFPAAEARRRGLTFLMVRRMKDVYPRAIQLVRSGQVDVDSIVSHRFGLADSATAFAQAAARVGHKIIIDPSR